MAKPVPPVDIPFVSGDIAQVAIFLGIGLLAGWIASLLLGGGGLVRNLIVGVLGAVVGGYVLKLANYSLPIDNPWLSQIITATLGAVIVIAVAKLVAK